MLFTGHYTRQPVVFFFKSARDAVRLRSFFVQLGQTFPMYSMPNGIVSGS